MFDKFAVQSLYGCTTQPTGKFVQFSTNPETNEKAFLEFRASLCHRNSKKLVVKSRRKLTLLLKRQNSPEIQAKRKQHADRCGNDTFACVNYLARLSKWIIHLTNLDWNGNCRNNVYLGKY